MKVLVTGNLGYIGPHVVKELNEASHETIGIDFPLFPNAVCQNWEGPTKQLFGDFRKLTDSEISEVDAIVHLAGLSNDPLGKINPGLTLNINGTESIALARRAKKLGVKIFAFSSSCSIYGSLGSTPKTEEDSTAPLSEYAESKLLAEHGLSELADNDFQVYLLRNSTAYGASPIFRTDLVVNDLASSMSATNRAEIRSDGSPWRPFIHCLDIARAFRIFLENPPKHLNGKPVNIGFNSENYQVKQVGNAVLKCWPKGIIDYSDSPQADPRDYMVDFSLLEATYPEFQPSFSLENGIYNLREFLQEIGFSTKDILSKRYVRIHEVQGQLSKFD